jgi:hypothetical protein
MPGTAVGAALAVPAGVYNAGDDEPVISLRLTESLTSALGVPPPRPSHQDRTDVAQRNGRVAHGIPAGVQPSVPPSNGMGTPHPSARPDGPRSPRSNGDPREPGPSWRSGTTGQARHQEEHDPYAKAATLMNPNPPGEARATAHRVDPKYAPVLIPAIMAIAMSLVSAIARHGLAPTLVPAWLTSFALGVVVAVATAILVASPVQRLVGYLTGAPRRLPPEHRRCASATAAGAAVMDRSGLATRGSAALLAAGAVLVPRLPSKDASPQTWTGGAALGAGLQAGAPVGLAGPQRRHRALWSSVIGMLLAGTVRRHAGRPQRAWPGHNRWPSRRSGGPARPARQGRRPGPGAAVGAPHRP